MATSTKIIYNSMEAGKYTVTENKAKIETHVAARRYYNFPERIIERNKNIFAMETISNITAK